MSFTEIRFPENISYGSTGGPEFSTDIVTTHNGCEQRNYNAPHKLDQKKMVDPSRKVKG